MSRRLQLRSSAVALVAGAVLLTGGPASASGTVLARVPEPARATAPGVYVVTLADAPAASYDGGVRGLSATAPADGRRFDRTRPSVRAYTRWLLARQDRLLSTVGDPAVLYRYTTALDGFAARLTSDQVRHLRRAPGVLRVERSTTAPIDRTAATSLAGGSTLHLLGLDGPRGVWAAVGGPSQAGRATVVGVVDSGIWPENPSFSGLADPAPGTGRTLPGFSGACTPGVRWRPEDCTDKIVAARWFVHGFGARRIAGADFLSPRDGSGHGSHVASVAAGNHAVRVRVEGQRGRISGMAPAARLAVYKACWTAPDPADDGCTTADTVAAVDQAVADGVDVLNYSVTGSRVPDDSVGRAFLGAASAGVFVATSAGNGGRPGSVRHLSPWVTTVGAATHAGFSGEVRLGDGTARSGAMVSDRRVRVARLVLGSSVPAPGATRAAARRCLPGTLDAARVQGAVVVCDRGGGARVDKSAAVAEAGGTGMVLANTSRQGVDTDVHAVPTVHLDLREAAGVRAYVRREGTRATARLVPRGESGGAPAVAGFSARGPSGDVLKPDLTAPGVGVLGAVAPPSDGGRSWDLLSGTSTSAPHVAGLAALLLGERPAWSPARVKSAMMTSAYDATGPHGPLLEGAGHVRPRKFLDPGLVFDAAPPAWQRVAGGRQPVRDLNSPSIAVRDLVGPTTVVRRITHVGRRPESYTVRVQRLPGVDVQAFPATVRLRPGQSSTVRLRITARPSARVDTDVAGWLLWRGGRHRVRVPVVVRPTVVAAPREVDAARARGSVVVRGRSGNGRTVRLRSTGLVAARSTPVLVGSPAAAPVVPVPSAAPSRQDTAVEPAVEETAAVQVVQVPPDTAAARFQVVGRDLSLQVHHHGRPVAGSAEDPPGRVTLVDPQPGGYQLSVAAQASDDDGPGATTTTGRLDTWVVPERGGSAVSLSTDAVGFSPGRRFRYSASWRGLDPDKRYLGVVTYGDSGRRTVVAIR